jgi:fluoroacetyl-CoA thioesterase
MRVFGEAHVNVDGNRVEFAVHARDEHEEIGAGTHERMVVNVARLAQRLEKKTTPA